MDRRERVNSALVAVKAALEGFEAKVWTALPALVAGSGFSAAKMTVQAQPTVQAQVRTPSGSWVNATLPLCVDCPVMLQGGGGFLMTFPIAVGDEGLLVFASRCIDSWWHSGKVGPQAELRMHDLSDGFFIPECFSNPRVPGAVSTATAQLRSLDGESYVELAGGHVVNVVAPGGINFTGVATFNDGVVFKGVVSGQTGGGGTINLGNADILTTGTSTAADHLSSGKSGATHTHTQPADSHGDTESPTSAPV